MLYDENGIYRGIEENNSDEMMHYGTPHRGMERHSGRYPWGSGDHPFQRAQNFVQAYEKLYNMRDENGKRLFTKTQIAKSMDMTSTEFRKRLSLARATIRENQVQWARDMMDKYGDKESRSAVARRMGINESSLRQLLNEEVNARMSVVDRNAQLLKKQLETKDYIQVGSGVEYYLSSDGSKPVSDTSLRNTLHKLEQQGYTIHDIPVMQQGTMKTTKVRVLAKPGVEKKEILANQDRIQLPFDLPIYAEDNGTRLREVEKYVSVDPKRVTIAYPKDGGDAKDGVIEIRRGVQDLSLGDNHYAQVRILVDKDHYLKGMAVYADDLPEGKDIRFNTSKEDGTPMFKRNGVKDSVLKPIKEDLENPFGANIKPEEKLTRAQRHYIGEDGKEHLSAINIVKEEGDVDTWRRSLPSQFLSKQQPALVKRQLKLTYDIAKAKLDEIMAYTNPTVKASMLEDFAGRCESDAVHLASAALPRQRGRLILPLISIKDNEIYAPGFRDGEEVALVRFPHGHISEIPILTVNNNGKEGKKLMGQARDAVGISKAAATKLSGADFDGDTVTVIPLATADIKSKKAIPSMIGFADKMHEMYFNPNLPKMADMTKGIEMGKATNLITDMTFQGADDEEIARALRYSMVAIDAQKHSLDIAKCKKDNRIAELQEKYQGKAGGGVATLLSRSTHEVDVPERREKAYSLMTPEEKKRWENGEMVWTGTGYKGAIKQIKDNQFPTKLMTAEEKALWNQKTKDGKPDQEARYKVKKAMYADGRAVLGTKDATEKSTLGYENSPYDLLSRKNLEEVPRTERYYADYAAQMKELARMARKEARAQVDVKRDPEMAKLYAPEVASLKAKVAEAVKNRPLERQAQLIAGIRMRLKLDANPWLWSDKEHMKRERTRELDYARKQLGAKKLVIGSEQNPLTDREWEAIQKGAVSTKLLKDVLNNADGGRIKELALPKTKTGVSKGLLARAKAMLRNGYDRSDVCRMLDISEGKLNYALDQDGFKLD